MILTNHFIDFNNKCRIGFISCIAFYFLPFYVFLLEVFCVAVIIIALSLNATVEHAAASRNCTYRAIHYIIVGTRKNKGLHCPCNYGKK